ncbi:MAG: hypothetical protein DRP01_11240 [Archaeoglobales archaeon]|nr:MAG: hypothetical protein DRP01_11240 [Archaeoglobales archaeon]
MQRRLVLAIVVLLVTMVFFGANIAVPVFTTVIEPAVTIYGNLTKDIRDLNNIWLYTDENGKNVTLDYQRNGNITFTVDKIKWVDAFINESVQGTLTVSSNAEGSAQYLTDADGIPYILITVRNTSDITGGIGARLDDTCSITFDKDSYVFIVAEICYAEPPTPYVYFALKLIDMGGEDHVLEFQFLNVSGTNDITLVNSGIDNDNKEDDVQVKVFNVSVGEPFVYQRKITDIFSEAGLSTEIVKCEKVVYGANFVGSPYSASDNEVKTLFKAALISEKQIKINNIAVTSRQITIDSDSISINREIEKVADASIPFVYSVPYEKAFDDKNRKIDYDFEFLLPDGCELSFSSVKLNFTVPSGTVESLWINGQDYLDKISNKDPGTDVTLLSSVSAGTQYIVNCKVKYSEEEYYEIAMSIKLAWWSPRSWIDKLLAILLAIVNFFGGIGATYIKRLRTRIRTP